jgi:hypothetical protein
MYPSNEEFKEAAEACIKKTNNDYFVSMGHKWDTYYKKNIQKPVSIIFKLLIITNINSKY